MATLYSKQRAQIIAQGVDPLEVYEENSRERSSFYSFNTTDQGGDAAAVGDKIILAKVPPHRKLDGISYATDGLGAGWGVQIGIEGADGSGSYDKSGNADDPDFFSASVDLSAVANGEIGKSLAEQNGYLTVKEVFITATIIDLGGFTSTANRNLQGKVYYAGS